MSAAPEMLEVRAGETAAIISRASKWAGGDEESVGVVSRATPPLKSYVI
jgi:hypothetical protein